MRVLFVLFIIVPLLEMLLLIKVGGLIGALPTIALVCLTAFIGVGLIRAQGFMTMHRAQEKMARGQVPAQEMLDGLSLVIGGVLLLTPGFFTDALGFVLLIPSLRRVLLHKVLAKVMANGRFTATGPMNRGQFGDASNDGPRVFQGEFEREHGDSGERANERGHEPSNERDKP